MWHNPHIWRILGFQLRAKAHSALVFHPTWLASRGLLFVYIVDSLIYAMGDPFTVDYQLGVCCTFAVGTKGHGRPWLRSCGHNMECWVEILAPPHFRGRKGVAYHWMPVGGQASQLYRYVRQSIWFSRSALWHNSSNIGYIEWLFIYICLFLIKIWKYIYGIRYLSLIKFIAIRDNIIINE